MRSHLLRRLSARSAPRGIVSTLLAPLGIVSQRLALLGMVSTLLALPARAQDPPAATRGVSLTLSAPEHLVAGTTAAVIAELRVPPGDAPLLLTPTTEGTAVEVVRGRLLRADAERTDAGMLRFRIPIMAKAAGTAVLRVRVLTYACARRCRAEEADAFIVLRVDRP